MKCSLLVLANFLFFFATAQNSSVPASIYDFKIPALKGGTIDMSQYKGKKILIVNTPQEADYSLQYKELENLYQQNKGNLVIIGFITNDFQIEPGSKKNPSRERNYNVSFPLAAKVLVRGDQMAPIYKWLTEKQYNKLADNEIQWDFEKFLIDENGNLKAVFLPTIRAYSDDIKMAIQK